MATVIHGQTVISHLLPQDGPHWVLALSTRIGDRTLLTGIGVGDDPTTMTPVAHQVLRVLTEHADKDKEVFVVLCRNKETAVARVQVAVAAAKDGQIVFVLCKDSAVYDAVNITHLLAVEP
jgi:hypothetical protein